MQPHHSKQVKPIQLIKFDQKKNIFLTPQAIELFNNKLQSKQLCIVCVAGKYRTGKSYILNRVLLEQSHGFEVGPTINACTKGLWMWPEIVKINVCGRSKECIVIDTEGLGSLQEGENTDLKIFLMAMLLSSYLIYNSVGSIDQKALQSLNLVISMAQLLQKSGDRFDSQQLINSFPSFMWLVRDFSLRLEDENGQTITSQQYLENGLRAQKGKSVAAQKKNQIRRQLKTFFQQRDCFTLIRPTLNEKDLQNLSLLPQKKLRPQFVALIKELRSRIHNSILPKKIRGKSINPQGFIELCNYYITNINSGKLPSINSHWDNLCISESGRLFKKYQMKLKEFVDQKMIKQEEIGEFELKLFGENVLKEACETVDMSFLGKLEKKLLKQKLIEKLNQKLMEVFEFQYKNQQQLVEKSVKQLFTLHNSNPQDSPSQSNENSLQNFNFYHKIDSLKQKFTSFNKIMSQHINQKGSSTKMNCEFIKRMYQYCFEQIQQQLITPIQQEFFNLSQDNKELREKMKHVCEKLELTEKEDKNLIQNLRREIEQTERERKKMIMNNNKLQDKIKHLQKQNVSLRKQVKQLKTTFQHQQQQHQINLNKIRSQLQTNSSSLHQRIKYLQAQIQSLHQNQQSLSQQLKDCQIKSRKSNRQCEIYKQKLMEKQKQNEEVVKLIEQARNQVDRLEKEKRKILKKFNSQNLSSLVKSISSKTKSIEIDVSYVYDSEGLPNFLFDISLELNNQQDQVDALGLFSSQEAKPIKWQLLKSLKFIQFLLKLLKKPTHDITLFTQQQNDNYQQQQKINLNQKRRFYLDELCRTLSPQIFKRNSLIEYFGLDLHILRQKKYLKRKKSFVKQKKIGLLNLQLEQIVEEPHQNMTSLKPYNKIISQSMNFMKTTKFSMKKVFKFGPNV